MRIFESNVWLASTVLRIVVGAILLSHGLPKALSAGGIEQFADAVGGIMGSDVLGWVFGLLTIFVEIVGGIMLIVGAKVRLVGLAAALLFAGITLIVQGPNFWLIFNANSGDAQTKFEFPALIAEAGLALAFLGPGRYSITRD